MTSLILCGVSDGPVDGSVDSRTTQPSTDDSAEHVRYLRARLGDPFTNWLLDNPGESLSAVQAEVARSVAATVRRHIEQSPELPVDLAISGLVIYQPGLRGSVIDLLHTKVAGAPRIEETGDAVLDALMQMTAHGYGELLLQSAHRFTPTALAPNPFGTALLTAVAKDPAFPYTEEDPEEDQVVVTLPTGWQSGLQWVLLGSSIIQYAWELAKLHVAVPTLDDVLSQLPKALNQARDVFAGRTIELTGLASLTGVVLPLGKEVMLPWGRLRAARREDHPLLIGDLVDRSTVGRTGTAEKVTISDAGDVILEVKIRTKIGISPAGSNPRMVVSGREELERRITEVRLAHLLADDSDQTAVILPVWRRLLTPISGGMLSVSWSDPRLFASRSPTALSDPQVATWSDWITQLSKVNIGRLGVASARILRAAAERRDAYDSLIDAVIAWEALLGAETEITFRLSSAIARLLHPAGDERRAARKRIAEIYVLRSAVIHGTERNRAEVSKASREALSIGINVIRTLVAQPELLKMAPGERGIEILMS